jgi:hypothetical protein
MVAAIVGAVVLVVVALTLTTVTIMHNRNASSATASSPTVSVPPTPSPTTSASAAGTTGASDSNAATSSTPPASDTPSTPGVTPGQAIAMSAGQCIQDIPKAASITDLVLVACNLPHLYQVGSTYSPLPSGAPYPGADTLKKSAERECPIRLGKVVITAAASKLSYTSLYPEKSEWDGGDHSIKCLVTSKNGTPLTSSVIG